MFLIGTIFGSNGSSGLNLPGPFADDAEAAANGVEINKPYFMLLSMEFGLPTGTLRVRVV